MIDYKIEAAKLIKKASSEFEGLDVDSLIETPPSREMGDYAFPTFSLAKIMRKNPNLIASEIKNEIGESELFEKIKTEGAYVNFTIKKDRMVKDVLEEIGNKREQYGSSDIGKGKNVIVEYSSPNIAKPFHIGHIRTTVIGNAIANIYRFLGYNTISINHLGDYGTQFGLLIHAYKLWGDDEAIERDPINELLKLYVRINAEAEENPDLMKCARECFKELENGNEEYIRLWNWFKELSIKEFNKVYDILGIKFDSYAGEAFYSDKMQEVIDMLKEKNLLRESEGAMVVDMDEEGMPPVLIQKSDGSSLYSTRDIAAAIYRKRTYDFDKNIYVVASEQNLHFKAWREVLKKMGYDWAEDCIHIPFGMVSLQDGSLSTRKGRVLQLIDVLNKATDMAYNVIKERDFNDDEKKKLAQEIGVGAIIFQELFHQRIKDYVFSWDRALSFEGETGPYVQYTYARINSILNKGMFDANTEIDYTLLKEDQELELCRLMYKFPSVIINAHEKFEPFYVTRCIVEIAKVFNSYYNSVPILVEYLKIKQARLKLASAVMTVLKNGLTLLGINAPERM